MIPRVTPFTSLTALGLLVLLASCAFAVTPAARYSASPEQTGLAWSDVTFPSSRDSVALTGWWFEGLPDAPVLVLCDRGRGSMADLLVAAREFVGRGFSVLTFDYRDFGPSGPGEVDSLRTLVFASRWVNDAEGALHFARTRAAGRPVFAWGQDLGGAVAVAAAARARSNADAVALEGLFRTVAEVLYDNGTSQVPDVLKRHASLVEVQDEPISAVRRLLIPLHVVIARKDEVTPPEWTQEVTRQSLSRIDRWILPAAGHDGIELTPGYWDRLSNWYTGIATAMRAAR